MEALDALEPLDTFQAASFRAAVGLIGYSVLDRLDCQYAATAVRSATTEPTKLDWMRMMRLAKFQVAHNELEWLYHAQDVPEKYAVYGDSDWAGSETRRSTTRASEQLGQDPIEFSCSTQHVVALSSGEAELYATGCAAAGGLRSVQLLTEAGLELQLEVLTDSTANLGMHNRVGSGRVRHLDVKWLWAQEAVQAGRFSLKKVSTDSNVSDLTTKHHSEERRDVLMTLRRLRYTRGREEAVSMAGEGQIAAMVNAVENETWLKPLVGTFSLTDPGGYELEKLDDGRWAQRGGEQHASVTLDRRRSGDKLNCDEFQFDCGEDAVTTAGYNELGLGLISCEACGH